LVLDETAICQQHLTRTTLTDIEVINRVFYQLTPACRPQSFFESTSCRICLSRERSATSCYILLIARLFSR
jgi:hypothetical protein